MDEKRNTDAGEPELEAHRGELLPPREAMSLISTDPAQANAYTGSLEGFGGTPSAGAAEGAAGAAQGASGLVDADASGSAGESVTEEDRSEHLSQSDTASSQT